MRTVRCSGRPGGGCLPRRCVWLPHPCVDRMTDTCKTLPCRNYVADGNNYWYILEVSICPSGYGRLLKCILNNTTHKFIRYTLTGISNPVIILTLVVWPVNIASGPSWSLTHLRLWSRWNFRKKLTFSHMCQPGWNFLNELISIWWNKQELIETFNAVI